MNEKDKQNSKQPETGNHTDPMPEHGNDKNGHQDNGNHNGWNKKPSESHAIVL